MYVGTGSNAAYIEPSKDGEIINIEWGNFNKQLPRTPIDYIVRLLFFFIFFFQFFCFLGFVFCVCVLFCYKATFFIQTQISMVFHGYLCVCVCVCVFVFDGFMPQKT